MLQGVVNLAIEAGECRQSDENQAQKEGERTITFFYAQDLKEYPFLPSFHRSEILQYAPTSAAVSTTRPA